MRDSEEQRDESSRLEADSHIYLLRQSIRIHAVSQVRRTSHEREEGEADGRYLIAHSSCRGEDVVEEDDVGESRVDHDVLVGEHRRASPFREVGIVESPPETAVGNLDDCGSHLSDL
ncbi:hypothetical protein PMAYCL1PPCAC_25660, partial [Pristionchus mayeri]